MSRNNRNSKRSVLKSKNGKRNINPAFDQKRRKRKKKDEEEIALTPEREKISINWYPGHMVKALRQVKEKLKLVDVVLEIRDARAPLASANPSLDDAIKDKKRLIILNKANLADEEVNKKWDLWFKQQGIPYLFINSLEKSCVDNILVKTKVILDEKIQTLIEKGQKNPLIRIMIIGLPNTGKSTIINRLAGKQSTRTADKPGQTRAQQWIKIRKEAELLDTPGIMSPRVKNDEQGLWLCAIHAIRDEIVGQERISIFLINYLIQNKCEKFKERYELETLDIDPIEAIDLIGKNKKLIRKQGMVDYDRVYKVILSDFRKGEFGRLSFENPPN